jgi:hypothetical protein
MRLAALLLALSLQQPALTPEQRIDDVVSGVMSYHENELCIRYDAPPPHVRFVEGREPGFVAEYNVESQEILLDQSYRGCDTTALARDVRTPVEGCAYELREVLSHELGHYLTHLRVQRSTDSWLKPYFRHDDVTDIGVLVVVEGIGEYFGKAFTHDAPQCGGWEIPRDESDLKSGDFRTWLSYLCGYTLAKPVLENNGSSGLDWLVEHALTIERADITSILRYQERALNDGRRPGR